MRADDRLLRAARRRAERDRRRDQARVPRARARAAPRRERRGRGGGGALQGGVGRVRGAARPGASAPVRHVRRRRSRRGAARRRRVRLRRPLRRVLLRWASAAAVAAVRRAVRTPRPRCSSTSSTPRSASPPPSSSTCPVRATAATAAAASPARMPSACPECGGSGEVRQVRKSILGQLVTAAPCFRCEGSGQVVPNPCTQCRGDGRVRTRREIEVEVPAGIDDGQRLRLPGRGPAAPRGGAPGDLYVLVRVRPHPTLERHGVDLVHRRTIAMTQAALGASFDLETLDGEERITVEPGTQPGHLLRLRGRGVPVLNGRGRGDLHRRDRRRGAAQAHGRRSRAARAVRVAARRGDRPARVGLLLQAAVRLRRSVTARAPVTGTGWAAAAGARALAFVDAPPDRRRTAVDRRCRRSPPAAGAAARRRRDGGASPTAPGGWVRDPGRGGARRRDPRRRRRRGQHRTAADTPSSRSRSRRRSVTMGPRSPTSSSSSAWTASSRCAPNAASCAGTAAAARQARSIGCDGSRARPRCSASAPGFPRSRRRARRPSWPTRAGVVLADPRGVAVSRASLPDGDAWVVLVGPEGGFRSRRSSRRSRRAPRVAIGPHVLRVRDRAGGGRGRARRRCRDVPVDPLRTRRRRSSREVRLRRGFVP